MLILYNLLYILFALCYLPFFFIRGKWRLGMLTRLGFFPADVLNKIKNQKVIWLHTVSVGEALAARTLVQNLKRLYPDTRLVISTVTSTGNQMARRLAEEQDLVIYAPLDISLITRRVISLLNPRLMLIAETEIWPNLITQLARRDIPVVLVNGRISNASFRGYKLIRPFLRNIFRGVSLFCMQTAQDAGRIIQLGAEQARVEVSGNMKFDLEEAPNLSQKLDLGLTDQEKLWIAGSTHRGEEKIILAVYQELIKSYPALRLLIAPRHIERTKEIENLIAQFGFKSQVTSLLNLDKPTNRQTDKPTILILDTIGQLKSLYAAAELIFIGGSLIAHGGQNPIEAAVLSKPLIFGPQMANFAEVSRLLLQRQAAIMVKDVSGLREAAAKFLADPQFARQTGARAHQLVQENKGATLKTIELLKTFL